MAMAKRLEALNAATKAAKEREAATAEGGEEKKTLTSEEALKYLMATTKILIGNSNAIVEQLQQLRKEVDAINEKLGIKPYLNQ